MNIQRIQSLSWLGAILVGVTLGSEVADFLRNKDALREPTVSEADATRALKHQVEEPAPLEDTRVSVDEVETIFHTTSWSGVERVEPVAPVVTPEKPKVVHTPVSELLSVLAIQMDLEDATRSIAFVKFLDPSLAQLRREPSFQILHVDERLGGKYQNVRVAEVHLDGVLFAFDDEEREPELVHALEYDAEGAAIVPVDPDQVKSPRRDSLIARDGQPFMPPPRQFEQVRPNRFEIGTDEIRDLDQNYSEILSRDLSYRSARDRAGNMIGIQVTRVAKGSLPERAGLAPGEVLKSINGHSVRSVAEAIKFVKQNAETTNTWEAVFEKQGREFTRTYTSPVE